MAFWPTPFGFFDRLLGTEKRAGRGCGQRRRNPIELHADVDDPELKQISKRFHGTPTEIAELGPDQRQPPPKHVVVIGEEVESVYRPDADSRRGGVEYVHAAGDQGEGKPRLRGKGYWVTDGRRRWWVPGTSKGRFSPDSGMIG